MTHEWIEKFEKAVRVYKIAEFSGASTPAEKRAEAAKTFREYATEFENGGVLALEILKQNTKNENPYYFNLAFRLLVEMKSREAMNLIASQITTPNSRYLRFETVRLLGKQNPMPVDIWRRLAREVLEDLSSYRNSIVEVLLRHKTDQAIELHKKLLEKRDSVIGEEVAKALAKWGDFELLTDLIRIPLEQIEDDYYGYDIRIDAAFYLALYGKNEEAIKYLVSIANESDLRKAAHAVLKLSYLARPEAIEPTIRLLKSEDSIAVGFTLDSASCLGTPILGDALLHLASQPPTFRNDLVPVPLADEAVSTLAGITGRSDWGEPKYVEDTQYEAEWTQKSRDKAIDYYRKELEDFVPSKRYYRGEPLTLPVLADNLISVYAGRIWKSAYNLPAITGMDFEFDPDLDLISNLDAVIAWREYAATSTILEPGGWAFNGKPLPDPVF